MQLVKKEQKKMASIRLPMNVWEYLTKEAEKVGTSPSDAMSQIVLDWFVTETKTTKNKTPLDRPKVKRRYAKT